MTQIGVVIDGKYEILKQIGQGGMSIVYLAMDKRLNKQWAVKEVKKQANDKNNEVVVQSMITEANLIKRLDHPALPRIVDIIDNGETLYIVMDYIEGEPLDRVLDEYGAQPQETVIEWAKQICDVLNYLHTRNPAIIYRDMKPHNVMLKPEGNIKLIDFGIAREFKEQNLSDTIPLGTRGYAAPEQFKGSSHTQTDARTDIFCLGATLYHLVTGQSPSEPPYEMYPIRDWNPSLSGGLERIILKCTQQNPNDRYQNCAELMYELEHYEEIDDFYRQKQKNKLKAFVAMLSVSIILFAGSMTCFGLSSQFKTADYKYKIDLATENSLLEAINIDPSNKTAYLMLVDKLEQSGNYTDVGRKTILSIENDQNLITKLQSSNENYAEVAYKIGELYWLFGNGDTRDVSEATKWFKVAVDLNSEKMDVNQKELAQIFVNIGDFYAKEIKWNMGATVESGAYKTYWENVNRLADSFKGNDAIKIKLYNEIVSKSYDRRERILSDNVSTNDIVKSLENVSNKLKSIPETYLNESSKKQKADLISLCDNQITSMQKEVK